MTISIILPSFAEGGAIRTMITLAAGIAERGHDIQLVAIRNLGKMDDEVPDSVPIVRLGARRIRASVPKMVRYLREQRPLAVMPIANAANVATLYAARLAKTGVRVIATEHNNLSRKASSSWIPARRLMPRLCRWTYPWADAIISVSHGVADDLAQITSIDRGRLQVIYNPHRISRLESEARLPLDDAWFGRDQPPVILAAGRLEPQKDFPTLLHAFRKVRARVGARLLILGEGPDRGTLEALVGKLGLQEDVRLPGWDPNPFRYMARARLFVLSSRWEGLAGVLIEAMACGCPIVSTDCHSGPREILRDGGLGSLVPVGDIEALAEAIVVQLSNSPQTTGLRERAAEFSVEQAVDAYLSILLPSTADRTTHERPPALQPVAIK